MQPDSRSIQRATEVLNRYFELLRAASPKRWEEGQSAFVSTNPGVRANLAVLSEGALYLSRKKGLDFHVLKPDRVVQEIAQLVEPYIQFIAHASDGTVKEKFSRKFGEAGVNEYTFRIYQFISERFPDFGPESFKNWHHQRESKLIDDVRNFVLKLQGHLIGRVIERLKEIHGTEHLPSGDPAYWELGITKSSVRQNAYRKQQDDPLNRRRPKEAYLDVIDLIEIVKQKNNWMFFRDEFNHPLPTEKKGKTYYLDWLRKYNDLRKIAAHENPMKTYSKDDLELAEWLRTEVAPRLGFSNA